LYEMGPIHWFNWNPKNLTLEFNPYTWTNIANMIFLEAPVGVGFSYSTDESAYNLNDNITAADNHKALTVFFSEFPQFRSNKFWISGESYSGIYTPMLAELVMNDKAINFAGILVGNGVTDYRFDNFDNALLPFAYGHGLISTLTYNEYVKYCPTQPRSAQCKEASNQIDDAFDDIDIYDILSDCYHQRPQMRVTAEGVKLMDKKPGVQVPCIDSDKATTWLNTPAVQQAIHVNSNLTWAICSDAINYTSTVNSVIPIYQELMARNYSILVYSGDIDGAVCFWGTQSWLVSLNLPIKNLWRHWFLQREDGEQVAGYVTEYQGLQFATVKGAGHMVPQTKPEAAYAMFQRFITGQPL